MSETQETYGKTDNKLVATIPNGGDSEIRVQLLEGFGGQVLDIRQHEQIGRIKPIFSTAGVQVPVSALHQLKDAVEAAIMQAAAQQKGCAPEALSCGRCDVEIRDAAYAVCNGAGGLTCEDCA